MSLLKDVITGVKSTLQQFLPWSKFGAWRPFEDIEEEEKETYTKNDRFFDLYYYGLLEVGKWSEGLFQILKHEMRELSVITYPHLRILPITSADNPRNISPRFTRLNIRTSAAPHIRILPEAKFNSDIIRSLDRSVSHNKFK